MPRVARALSECRGSGPVGSRWCRTAGTPCRIVSIARHSGPPGTFGNLPLRSRRLGDGSGQHRCDQHLRGREHGSRASQCFGTLYESRLCERQLNCRSRGWVSMDSEKWAGGPFSAAVPQFVAAQPSWFGRSSTLRRGFPSDSPVLPVRSRPSGLPARAAEGAAPWTMTFECRCRTGPTTSSSAIRRASP